MIGQVTSKTKIKNEIGPNIVCFWVFEVVLFVMHENGILERVSIAHSLLIISISEGLHRVLTWKNVSEMKVFEL